MSVRTLITKSRKRFEDAVGPKEDHAAAFHMFADRDDILHLSYQETVAWALECHDRAKQPVRIEFAKPTEPKKVKLPPFTP